MTNNINGQESSWTFSDMNNGPKLPLQTYRDQLLTCFPSTLKPRPRERPPLVVSPFPGETYVPRTSTDDIFKPSIFERSPEVLRKALTHNEAAAPPFGSGPVHLKGIASLSTEEASDTSSAPGGFPPGEWGLSIWTVIAPNGEAGDLNVWRKKGTLRARVLLANSTATYIALPERALSSFGKNRDLTIRAYFQQEQEP